MGKKLVNALLLIVLFLSLPASLVFAQEKQDFKRSPVQTVELIANRLIRNTDFQYQLTPQKVSEDFNGIRFINFSRTYGDGKPGVAYALSSIESPADTTITLQVSHSDGLKIWVNHQLVYQKINLGNARVNYQERMIGLSDTFRFPVRKGHNEVLVKSQTKGSDWKIFLAPKSDLNGFKLSVRFLPGVDSTLARLTGWLCIGPFPDSLINGRSQGFNTVYEPEKEFNTSRLYVYKGREIAWTIPKIEVRAEATGPVLAWGDHNYSWNYHAGGVAWAMANLGQYTGDKAFEKYARNYCDFFVDKRPFLTYEKYELGELNNGDTKIRDSHMLDFTAAPALPFTFFLLKPETFAQKIGYQNLYNDIKKYVLQQQTRLPQGNFTRSTPHKFTTWADDMYMGIPFLVYSALMEHDPKQKNALLNDAASQILAFNSQLWDPEIGLYHQAQYSDRKVNIPYWSRANGWAIWAITIVLEHLPATHPLYPKLLAHYRRHIETLCNYQDSKTGFWHNLINKPDSYPETSGTAIFTMALAKGIDHGWLNAKKFTPFAKKGWLAIQSMVEEDGTLHGTCIGTNMSENIRDYYTRPTADNDTHGIFPVIFAGIAMDKLLHKK